MRLCDGAVIVIKKYTTSQTTMSFMGKIEDNMKEIKDKQNKLQADIDELNAKIKTYEDKEDFDRKDKLYLLWITHSCKYSDQMTGLNNRLKCLLDALCKLTIEEQKNNNVAAPMGMDINYIS